MVKRLLLTIAFISSFFSNAFCLPFNNNLSHEELALLNSGEIIIRKTTSAKNMCLETNNLEVFKEINEIKELNPAYLAEVIQVRPIKGNENIIEKTHKILIDIPSYIGIPYWSVQHERYFDLYEDGKVISTEIQNGIEHIIALLTMPPIGDIETDISITKNENFLLYKNTNLNNLYFKKIKCISEQNMRSVILIFKDNDKWILYGVGGVEAPTFFLMKKRIEISFLNRIKTFCNFVFEKL